MGVSKRPYKSPRVVNLDWMLVSVGLMALALLAASLIRTVPSYAVAEFGTKIGGLRALTETERLVLFEDLSTSPDPDWASGQSDDTQVGLGAIWLASHADAPMTRRIALPPQTQRSIVTMELIAIDAWALERLELSVDGTPVLRQSFSAEPALIAAQRTEILAQNGIVLQSRLDSPQELGFATGLGLRKRGYRSKWRSRQTRQSCDCRSCHCPRPMHRPMHDRPCGRSTILWSLRPTARAGHAVQAKARSSRARISGSAVTATRRPNS